MSITRYSEIISIQCQNLFDIVDSLEEVGLTKPAGKIQTVTCTIEEMADRINELHTQELENTVSEDAGMLSSLVKLAIKEDERKKELEYATESLEWILKNPMAHPNNIRAVVDSVLKRLEKIK